MNKLQTFTCVICKNLFYKHLPPSAIKSGRGKVCSKPCKSLLTRSQKRKGSFRNCKKCGVTFWLRPSEDRHKIRRDGTYYKRIFCSRNCSGKEQKECKMSTDGYWTKNVNGRDIKIHRTVMADYLGRELLPTEIVHHINGDKLDNRLENLHLCSRSEHNRIHNNLNR